MTRPENDLIGINNEDYWPNWPILPIKRRGGDDVFGYQFAIIHASDKTKAIFGNMFHLPKTFEEFKNLKGIQYNSVEALLRDGWVVD